MIAAVPREILENEHTVAALPEAVAAYARMGFRVPAKSLTGEGAYRTGRECAGAGAEIVSPPEELHSRADLIPKVKPACLNRMTGKHAVETMRRGAMLIRFLHPAAPADREIVEMLLDRNITSLTMDSIPRMSRSRPMGALTSMRTMSGYRPALISATHLPKFVPMIGTAIGITTPARFPMIGAGVVGLQAIATARRLGGVVEALDIRVAARQAAQSLGAKVVGFEIPPEVAADEVDQARPLPEEYRGTQAPAIRCTRRQTPSGCSKMHEPVWSDCRKACRTRARPLPRGRNQYLPEGVGHETSRSFRALCAKGPALPIPRAVSEPRRSETKQVRHPASVLDVWNYLVSQAQGRCDTSARLLGVSPQVQLVAGTQVFDGVCQH
jgi:NAD/NADP transhydrogenase alpha subunit